MTNSAKNEKHWKPVCHKESYDNPSTYGNEISYKNHWRMTRIEDGNAVVREMTWYERLYYGKGFPLEMEAWDVNAWAMFTFVVCLLIGAFFQDRLPFQLDEMCWKVAGFIMFVTILRVIFGVIVEFLIGPFVRRKNR